MHVTASSQPFGLASLQYALKAEDGLSLKYVRRAPKQVVGEDAAELRGVLEAHSEFLECSDVFVSKKHFQFIDEQDGKHCMCFDGHNLPRTAEQVEEFMEAASPVRPVLRQEAEVKTKPAVEEKPKAETKATVETKAPAKPKEEKPAKKKVKTFQQRRSDFDNDEQKAWDDLVEKKGILGEVDVEERHTSKLFRWDVAV